MSTTMKWHGDEVIKKVHGAQVKALRDSVEHLLTEANKTNPYREGTLERSGSTDVDESSLQGSVYYDTPYAIRVHEEPGLNYTDPKARWKWLEMTANDFITLYNEFQTFLQGLYQKEKNLQALVEAATTIEELEIIKW